MRAFACIVGLVRTSEQLCAAVTSVWLDYLKAKTMQLEVKDVLVHLVTSDPD